MYIIPINGEMVAIGALLYTLMPKPRTSCSRKNTHIYFIIKIVLIIIINVI